MPESVLLKFGVEVEHSKQYQGPSCTYIVRKDTNRTQTFILFYIGA